MSAMLAVLMFTSCQQQEDVTNDVEPSDDIARTFKYMSLEEQLALNQSETRASVHDDSDYMKNNLTIIICRWKEWGRTSKNCRGFGLCEFEWFPKDNKKLYDDKYINTYLQTDKTGQRFVDLFLSAPIPNANPDEMPQLHIDKSLKGELNKEAAGTVIDSLLNKGNINGVKIIPDSLIMRKGDYNYNPKLGTNGGYRIYLD